MPISGSWRYQKSEHGWINCAVLSPDGKHIALGTERGWAGVMDGVTGEPVASLVGHSLRVYSIAFSPDGKRVLTGSGDHTARIWEVDRGKLVATLKGHRDGLTAVAFSSDGKEALTISADGSAKLWDVPGDDLLSSQAASTKEIHAVAFSSDGMQLLSAGYDDTARVWDASSGRLVLVAELKGHDGIVVAATFTDDGERVITGSYDKTARIWDAKTGKETAKLSGHNNAVLSLGTDEARLISAGADWTVRTWDTTSRAPLSVFPIPGERREVIALSRDGRLAAFPGAENAANIWSVEDSKLVASLGVDTERLRHASFGPDGSRILLIRENDVVRHYRTAKIWDVAGRRPLVSLDEGADDMEVVSSAPTADAWFLGTTTAGSEYGTPKRGGC